MVPTTENGGLENVSDYRHHPFEEQINYRLTRKSPAEISIIAKEDIHEDEYQCVIIKSFFPLNSLSSDHDTSSVLSSPKPEQSFVSTHEELGYGQNYIEEGQKD